MALKKIEITVIGLGDRSYVVCVNDVVPFLGEAKAPTHLYYIRLCFTLRNGSPLWL
jgi:hypothetical protein